MPQIANKAVRITEIKHVKMGYSSETRLVIRPCFDWRRSLNSHFGNLRSQSKTAKDSKEGRCSIILEGSGA